MCLPKEVLALRSVFEHDSAPTFPFFPPRGGKVYVNSPPTSLSVVYLPGVTYQFGWCTYVFIVPSSLRANCKHTNFICQNYRWANTQPLMLESGVFVMTLTSSCGIFWE